MGTHERTMDANESPLETNWSLWVSKELPWVLCRRPLAVRGLSSVSLGRPRISSYDCLIGVLLWSPICATNGQPLISSGQSRPVVIRSPLGVRRYSEGLIWAPMGLLWPFHRLLVIF